MKEKLVYFSLKTIEFSFYSIFFLVPLVLSNNTSELFELNKMWITWSLTIVVVSAWITKMLAQRQFKIRRTPLDIPIILFLIGQILATIFSQDIHVSLWGYYSRFNGGLYSTLSYIALYYAFVSNYKDITKLPCKKPFSFWVRSGTLFGLICLLGISLPLSAPPDASSQGQGFIFFSTLLTVLAGAIYILRGKFLNRLLLITLFSGLIVTLWGIPSHFGTDATCYLFRGSLSTDCWTESFQPTVRIFSTLGQPAWMAAYLSFLIPVAVALSLRSVNFLTSPFAIFKRGPSLVFFALSLLFYVGLIFANTRGGFLGFWVGNAAFWIAFILIFRKRLKNALKTALVVNSAFLLLTFIFGIPITQLQGFTLPNLTARSFVAQVHAQPQNTDAQTPALEEQINITDSGNIRLNVWQGAIDAWIENPIFGTGVETFAFAYYKYKPEAQNLTSEWDFLYNKAHNEYLNYLATTGIVGLGTYLLLIAWFLFAVVKNALKNDWLNSHKTYSEDWHLSGNRILILAIVAGYLSILVSNFFGFSVVIINLFFFLAPALVLVLDPNFAKSSSLRWPVSQDEDQELSGLRLASTVIVLIIAFVLLLILYRFWQADKEYALGANLDRIGEYLAARPYLENSVKLRSGEPTFRDELAFNSAAFAASYLQQNDLQNGQMYLNEAEALSQSVIDKHPNNVVFWKNRVRLYALFTQIDERFLASALSAIEKANALAPGDAKILYNYGVILGQSGRVDEGIMKLEETIKLKPDYRDAYFALALFYHDRATNGVENGPVVDRDAQQKAEAALNFILENNPQDEQVKDTLESWK